MVGVGVGNTVIPRFIGCIAIGRKDGSGKVVGVGVGNPVRTGGILCGGSGEKDGSSKLLGIGVGNTVTPRFVGCEILIGRKVGSCKVVGV